MYKQASLLSLSKMSEKAFSFLAIIQLTYLFKPEAMGQFFFYFSFISLLIPLMDLGLKKVFVIHWNKANTEKSKLLGSLILLKLMLGLGCLFCAIIVDQLIHQADSSAINILFCFLAIFSDELSQLFRSADHACERYTYEIISPFIAKLSCLCLIYIFRSSFTSIQEVLAVYAASNLLSLVISTKAFRSCRPSFLISHLKNNSKKLIKEGIPFSFTSVFVMLAFYADSVILSFYSMEQTGFYNCAYRIIIVFGVLSGGLCHVLFTRFSRFSAQANTDEISRSLNQIIPIITVIFTGILFFVMALGEELINFVYSNEFAAAGDLMLLLAPFILLSALSNIFGHTLESLGLQKKVMKFNLYSCSVNIITNLLFIPFWGMYAAAITTLITESINCVLSFYAVRKAGVRIKLSPRIGLSLTALSFAAFYVSDMNLFIGASLASLSLIIITYLSIKNIQIQTGEESCAS